MTSVAKPKVFGTGLIALDLVLGLNPLSPVRSWQAERAEMSCQFSRTSAGTPFQSPG